MDLSRILTCVCALSCLAASAAEIRSTAYSTISEAIAACHAAGGGRVIVPKGDHETGPVIFKSNVELHFEDGAKLVFTDDLKAYLPAVETCWQGQDCLNYSPLLFISGVTNVAVTGRGVLAPKLAKWLAWRNLPGRLVAARAMREWGERNTPLAARDLTAIEGSGTRPQLVQVNRSKNVRLEGFATRGSPFWTVHVLRSQDVVLRDLNLNAWAEDGLVLNNSDGIDVEMSSRVLIEGCSFCQDDDAISIKAGKDADGRRYATPCEDVTIRNCTARKGHVLLCIGCEVSGGVRRVRMTDCTVEGEVGRVILVKTSPRRGGYIEDVEVSNIRARRVTGDAFSLLTRYYYGQPGEEVPDGPFELTRIRGIRVSNVHCDWAKRLVTLLGDPDCPARDIAVKNVTADEVLENFIRIENVDGVKVDAAAKKVYPDAHW